MFNEGFQGIDFHNNSDTQDRSWTFESTDKKEILFKHYVEEKIMKAYEKDLVMLGVFEKSLDDFRDALLDDEFSERDREIFFTLPYEIRLKIFRANLQEDILHMSSDDWKRFIRNIIDIFIGYNPHLGFHMSSHDIVKKKISREEREEWSIHGTEKDHRNYDQPMAYYSLSFEKLFRKKAGSNFLYIVRAMLKEGNNHYPDNDGHWGRAGTLAIIEKIDLGGQDINHFVKELEEKVDGVSTDDSGI